MTLHSLPVSCISIDWPWGVFHHTASGFHHTAAGRATLAAFGTPVYDFVYTGVPFCDTGRALIIAAFSTMKSLRHISRRFYSFCPKKKRKAKLQLVILTYNKLHNNIHIVFSNTPYSGIICKSALCDQYKTILCS